LIVLAVYWVVWNLPEHRSSASVISLSNASVCAGRSAIVVENRLMRLGFTFSDAIADRMTTAPFNDPMIWNLAILSLPSVVVVMLVDTQLCLSHGIVTALFAGLLAPTGIQKAVYAMISCAGLYTALASIVKDNP